MFPGDRDHPHPCGEKVVNCDVLSREQGSPPPMWGKVFRLQFPLTSKGITPTHVGKSYSAEQWEKLNKDHPHPCGEKLYQVLL